MKEHEYKAIVTVTKQYEIGFYSPTDEQARKDAETVANDEDFNSEKILSEDIKIEKVSRN